MITWFFLKEVLYDLCIQDMILNGDTMEKAMGIMWFPCLIFMVLGGLLMDIVGIPLYLIGGLVYLILKILERKK